MKIQDNLTKTRKYIQTFNPVVVQANVQHQDYLYAFNAGDDYKNFNEFIYKEWEEYLENKDGVTFLVFDKSETTSKKEIVAFYTLCAGAIPYTDRWRIPEEELDESGEEFDEQECGIPSIEIKMFAVTEKYQDCFFVIDGEERPIAAWILHDIICTIESLTASTIAAKAIFLHAIPTAENFYLQNGFNYAHPSMHAFHDVDSEYAPMFLALTKLHIHYDE